MADQPATAARCSCSPAVVDAVCPVHGYPLADLLRCADAYRWEAEDAV